MDKPIDAIKQLQPHSCDKDNRDRLKMPPPPQHKFHNAKGNVLFIILIAVALFAALSYAVISSNRSSGNDISKEQAEAYATFLINQASQLRAAATRVMINNSIDWWQIDWHDGATYSNPNCTQTSCKIEGADGGNALLYRTSEIRPAFLLKSGASGWSGLSYILSAVENVGTSAPDVVMTAAKLPLAVCNAINKRLGISGSTIWSEKVTTDISLAGAPTFGSGGFEPTTTSRIGDIPSEIAYKGHDMGCGCLVADCSDPYDSTFYAVIIEK